MLARRLVSSVVKYIDGVCVKSASSLDRLINRAGAETDTSKLEAPAAGAGTFTVD